MPRHYRGRHMRPRRHLDAALRTDAYARRSRRHRTVHLSRSAPARAAALILVCALTLAGVLASLPRATAGSVTFRFLPSADAYVSQAKPNYNFGGSPTLRTRAFPNLRHSYLRFDVAGLAGTVTSATLRLYGESTSSVGYSVRSVANAEWTENRITFANAPTPGAVVARSGSIARDAWSSVDVTALVRGNGMANFALTAISSSAGVYASRETGATAPQLIVNVLATTTTDGATTTAAPTTTSAAPTTTAASTSASTAPTTTAVAPGPGTTGATSSKFTMMNELYGDSGAVAQQQKKLGLASGWNFHATLTSGEQQFLTANKPPFAYFSIPSGANVSGCYPSATDPNTGPLLTSMTQQVGYDAWRFALPEFDQGGGCWATGRPSFSGTTDQQAYQAWTDFYLNTKGLGPYLNQTASQRGYKWLSLCVFAFCPQYAFDMGSDIVLLERNEDEVSGINPGVAMLRGAARQHGGKQWGVDLSTWRYWNDGPTVYNSTGKLVTGWSTATFKRNLFISYMSGANIIHNEAADYTTGGQNGGLNPLGQTVQQFGNFTLTRHPDRGIPYVPVAIMQNHYSGLEPKFGEWMQGPRTWYWNHPYDAGDTMLANLFSLIYPGYNSWGSIVSGAPWKVTNSDGSINVQATTAAYRQALASGADPRPWEPMGSSRWGETFDVITNHSSLDAMQQYKAIILSTGIVVNNTMLANLTEFVKQGGILIINAKQLPATADSLTGVHFTGGRASASSEIWLPDNSTITENSYNYSVATTITASTIAKTASGDPVVTKNSLGSGTVYVTTPDYMEDAGSTRILNVGQRLIDTVQSQLAVARVQGPRSEYLINTSGGKTVVTVVNTDLGGATWNGTVSFPTPSGSYTVREWTGDTTVASTVQNGQVVINGNVPPYDVRVYVLEPTP
jgi:hypothetical protein